MRRRNFIAGLASTTAAWPLAAHAQRADQVRRVGVLMNYASTDPEGQALLREFMRHFAELGWTDGRNVRIDVRWGGSNENTNGLLRQYFPRAPSQDLGVRNSCR